MLPVSNSGLLSASPATKTQQSQITSDRPILRQLNKDTLSFQKGLSKETKAFVAKKIRDPEGIVCYVERKFENKTNKDKKEFYKDIKQELKDLGAFTGDIQQIEDVIDLIKI